MESVAVVMAGIYFATWKSPEQDLGDCGEIKGGWAGWGSGGGWDLLGHKHIWAIFFLKCCLLQRLGRVVTLYLQNLNTNVGNQKPWKTPTSAISCPHILPSCPWCSCTGPWQPQGLSQCTLLEHCCTVFMYLFNCIYILYLYLSKRVSCWGIITRPIHCCHRTHSFHPFVCFFHLFVFSCLLVSTFLNIFTCKMQVVPERQVMLHLSGNSIFCFGSLCFPRSTWTFLFFVFIVHRPPERMHPKSEYLRSILVTGKSWKMQRNFSQKYKLRQKEIINLDRNI